jgi:hypothetical protein
MASPGRDGSRGGQFLKKIRKGPMDNLSARGYKT